MKTTTNTVTFKANEKTGAVAVVWTSEVCMVGGKVRVALWRNGNVWCEDIAAGEVNEAISYCARAGKCVTRTAKKLVAMG